MTGANMNFMQPVTASYTGHDSDAGFVPSSLKLQHKELSKENFFSYFTINVLNEKRWRATERQTLCRWEESRININQTKSYSSITDETVITFTAILFELYFYNLQILI